MPSWWQSKTPVWESRGSDWRLEQACKYIKPKHQARTPGGGQDVDWKEENNPGVRGKLNFKLIGVTSGLPIFMRRHHAGGEEALVGGAVPPGPLPRLHHPARLVQCAVLSPHTANFDIAPIGKALTKCTQSQFGGLTCSVVQPIFHLPRPA